MNKKYKKMLSAIAGAAVLTTVGFSFAFPEHAAAAVKWISLKPFIITETQDAADNNVFGETNNKEETAASVEAVITNQNGEMQRVALIDTNDKEAISVHVNKDVAEELQHEVDKGQKMWLLDPVQVVRNNAGKYGFDGKRDTFTLISQINADKSLGMGKAKVLVGHGNKYYLVDLIQPTGSGINRIWQIVSIKEVKTVINHPQKPDVGPGVEGLDYDKVVKWQQNVDAGRELWRLDPMQVAKNEGTSYGFTDKDTYTIVRKLSSSTIARHGQIDIEVNHLGKVYTMVLVKPFGGRDAIWTTYKVYGTSKPEKPAVEKVLFETNKYAEWKWYYGQYPQDMAFTTIVDYDAQLKYDPRIPELVLEKTKSIDFKNKVVLFAYFGSASAGSDIGIEKVTLSGKNMIVNVHTKSPRPDEVITRNVIFPYDYVSIDRSIIERLGTVNVTFVDQNGKVLSKNKLTIRYAK